MPKLEDKAFSQPKSSKTKLWMEFQLSALSRHWDGRTWYKKAKNSKNNDIFLFSSVCITGLIKVTHLKQHLAHSVYLNSHVKNLALRVSHWIHKILKNMLKLKRAIKNPLRKLQLKFYYISCLEGSPPTEAHFGFKIVQWDHLNLGVKMTARMRDFRIFPFWQPLKPFS